MNRHVIIGTAGHIDHGKTALIKALSGIDTDRLKEEKERGITIDIGFAYWHDNVTIIDVPGHEKFIRNMVAGVSTIDFFLLVIAADDGIMPQTIEHLDILNFFNIRDGIVVINKIDLVDRPWLELVQQEVVNLLKKYGLEHLTVIPVSAVQNINIDQLRQVIEAKIDGTRHKHSSRPFRLLIDRSFQIKGFGTVVTGTVLSGSLNQGAEVEVYPGSKITKVRGLQVHSRDTSQVEINQRAAVNLSDLTRDDVSRGDVLASPGTMLPVLEFSGILRTVSHIPVQIKNRSRVHVYTGTAEKPGHIFWYEDIRFLQANQSYHVRIKLNETVAAAPGDAFLVRLHSPVLTLAGGNILEINPVRLVLAEKNWQEYFAVMSGNNLLAQIERIIFDQGLNPLPCNFLQAKLFEQPDTTKKYITELAAAGKIRVITIKGSEHCIHAVHFGLLGQEILRYIENYHRQNPLKAGISLPELRTGTGKNWLPEELYIAVLQHLMKSNLIKQDHHVYYFAGFTIKIARDLNQVGQRLLEKLAKAKFSPPDIDELSELLQMPVAELRILINTLIRQNLLTPVNQKLFLHHAVHEQLIQFLRNYFTNQSQMPVAALKDFIATTRKYAIPIFEYLDASGFTVRSGDVRKKGPNL
jgi:selenocysteine-specific elongation factor